jgi:3-hydroxypropanoate dehydrogenase
MAFSSLNDAALDQLFRNARTYNAWKDEPIDDALLHKLADLMKLGPTAANSTPARIVFVKTEAAKKKLEPHVSEGNRAKTMTAPVVAIIGYDLEFYEKLNILFPHAPDARNWYAGRDDAILETAFRNSSLQGGYFILAARALGLDCGPMSGFDNQGVDAAFFPDGKVKSNFICALGKGDATKNFFPRNPRLNFEDFAQIL